MINKEQILKRAAAKVDAIITICSRKGPIIVLMQDNPDPDAIASAAALRDLVYTRLKKRVAIGYGGACGRAENRAMLRLLHIDARPIKQTTLSHYTTICLVDAQPLAGNNIAGGLKQPQIVIDHHLPPRKRPWTAEFTDLRPDYGATSTILYEYLIATGIQPSTNLATALFYGIQSDTQDLGREANDIDIHAYRELFLLADRKKLARIHRAPVPITYYRTLTEGLTHSIIAGSAIISILRSCRSSDIVAEIADLLLRLEGMESAICCGVCGDKICLSVRVKHAKNNAAKLIRQVVRNIGSGGGHRRMAGGRIPITGNADELLERVRNRILKTFAPGSTPTPLMNIPSRQPPPSCESPSPTRRP